MPSTGGDKTEKPTPQRLKKAREEGQFLSARGIVSAVQFIVTLVLLEKLLPSWQGQLKLSIASLFEHAMTKDIGETEWIHSIRSVLLDALLPLLKMGGTLLLFSLAANFAMTKMGFSLKRLTPKFTNFNPISRLRELPSRNLSSVAEAAVLLILLAVTMFSFVRENTTALLRMPFESVPTAAAQIGAFLQALLWKAAALFVVFGSVDLFRQYRKYMSGLRMTKQEIREEHKRNEGDPQLKTRIRRLRRDLLRRQMMREVPKATAVIVNPTHFAVAIRYEVETMPCPVVVAKGKNWLALRIRQIATEHQVPIIENPPLARALYQAIDVGRAIPPEFYKAIAEILAYIYRLMGRKLPT
jgi:flagellar biosynthesis protein FlhB